MGPIAVGLGLGMFAHAHLGTFLLSGELDWGEGSVFVGSVTERLAFGEPARAPIILFSGLELSPT